MQNIGLRLPETDLQKYANLAQSENKPLATFLREKLVTAVEQETILKNIHIAITQLQLDQVKHQETQQPSTAQYGIFLEILLLLRTLCPPNSVSMIQKEVERQGFTIWKG